MTAVLNGHDMSGTTANRPTNAELGQPYFDTTLQVLYVCTQASPQQWKSVSGHVSITTVAATGTNQGTAAALSAGGLSNVTGADGTKATVLPTNVTTDFVYVFNNGPSNLKVYAAGTNTINGGSAGGFVTLEPSQLSTFVALDGANWAFDGTATDIGPLIIDSITGAVTPLPIVGLAGTVGGAVTVTAGAASAGVGGAVTVTASAGVGGTNAGGNVNLVPGAAASTGIPGEVQVNANSQLILANEALTATDATRTILIATRPMRLKAVSVVWTTGSTSGTLQLEKATGTTAPGAGTALLTGTVTLAGTANTVGNGTLVATVASITLAAGDRLNMVIAGTMTNLVGAKMTVALTPV